MASEKVNDTIVNMITNLKPQLQDESFVCEPSGSLKRPNTSSASSDSFDIPTPTKRFKLDQSVDYIASPRETRRLRTDLLEARNNIKSLENRIQHMHNVRKEVQLMYDNEIAGLKQQRKHDQKSIEDLEAQLQSIRKRELETKTEFNEIKGKYDDLKLLTDQQIESLEKELSDVKVDVYADNEQNNEEMVNLKLEYDKLDSFLDITKDELEEHQILCEDLKRQLSEKEEVERNLELKDQALQKARLELKNLEYLKENYEEYQQQLKSHYHKLSSYTELEKENLQIKEDNKHLHDAVQNKLLLEEEVHNLKTQLVRYKEQEKVLSELQTSQIQNELHLNEWKAVARGICESTGSDSTLPHLLRIAVERLQQQEINLTSSKVELESQLNTAIHDSKVARSELEKNQKLLTELQSSNQQRQNLIHRLQKKVLLVSRERDSYRLQLDSYERDLTMCVPHVTNSLPSVQQTYKDRIENLERMLEGYREMVTKLETDLQSVEPNFSTENVPIRVEQVNRLKEEVDKLKMDNNHLREQKEQLEIRLEELAVGSDLNNTGRIVHLANNPLAECIEAHDNNIDKLLEEVHRLKRKVRNLEEGLEASKLNESIMSPQEIQSLKDQLISAENQVQRLKDYFKSSMQEYRNVVHMLFGYKVEKMQNSKFKLISTYAEQAEDQLWFQLSSDGTLNLLANDFSSSLDEFIDIHLRQQASIPVFLSAITMDLFSNKTLASSKVFEVDDD